MRKISRTLVYFAAFVFLAAGIISCTSNNAMMAKSHAGKSSFIESGVVHDRIISVGTKDSRVMDHLNHLTNRIGPRQTGSDNYQTASEWARDQFKRFGLSNAHLERVAEIPIGFNRGTSSGAILSPKNKRLHFSTHAWTAGTRGRTSARAVLAPESEDDLEKMGADIEGRWILWRPFDDPEKNASYIEKWDELNFDVAGVILPSSGEFIHTFGNYRGLEWDDLPTTPSIILLQEEWEEIADLLGEGEEVTLEFDIRNYFKKGPIPIYNVVADIPGTELPDEYVIVGAHLDSHDGATGAADNGTGVAAAMEAARILAEAGIRPRRTIRFVLFAGEEVGMLGSRAYVTDHSDQLDKISAMFNMDQGADYISGILATEPMLEDFKEIFAPVKSLNEDMPFGIGLVESLPQTITDCCGNGPARSPLMVGGVGKTVIKEKIADSGCGGGGCGSPSLVTDSGGGGGGCGGGGGGCGGQSLVKNTEGGGGCGGGGCGGQAFTKQNVTAEEKATTTRKRIVKAVGSSDHAQFLAAGVPAFMWMQQGENPVPYYPHTQRDTYEQVIPKYQKHSATVIALAALGVANLDHLLLRENLVDDETSSKPAGSGSFLFEEQSSLIKSTSVETGYYPHSSKTTGTPDPKASGCCPSGCCTAGQRNGDCCPQGESGCCPTQSKDCCPPGSSSSKTQSCCGRSI
ncbi:MAG: M20/M25/M40 family metallo-hydrolase [Gemmatimonadota bacterium]|nr:MAG: M20/M25/M40 family metallo-hydrolase [Gemmatimonadota bacterium]